MKNILFMAIALMSAIASFGQELQSFTDNKGNEWLAYGVNGVKIGARAETNNDLGKWYIVFFMVHNVNGETITLDPSLVKAHIVKKDKKTELKVYDHDSFVKNLQAKQSAKSFGSALLGGSEPGRVNTENLDKWYIQNNKIPTGGDFWGYLYTEYKKGEKLSIVVSVAGTELTYEFDVNKSNDTPTAVGGFQINR